MGLQGKRRRGIDGSAAAGEFLALPDGESAAVRPNQQVDSGAAGGEQSAAIVETGEGVGAAVNFSHLFRQQQGPAPTKSTVPGSGRFSAAAGGSAHLGRPGVRPHPGPAHRHVPVRGRPGRVQALDGLLNRYGGQTPPTAGPGSFRRRSHGRRGSVRAEGN